MPIESKEQAEALLKELSAYYKEPVKPISEYCNALKTWAKAMNDRVTRKREELYPDTKYLEEKNADAEYVREYEARSKAAWDAYHADKRVEEERCGPLSGFYARARYEGRRALTEREHEIEALRDIEKRAEQIDFVFLQIQKSCLLFACRFLSFLNFLV